MRRKRQDNEAQAIEIEIYHKYIHSKINFSDALAKFKKAEELAQTPDVKKSIQKKVWFILKQEVDRLSYKGDINEAKNAIETCTNYLNNQFVEIDLPALKQKIDLLQNSSNLNEEIERDILKRIEAIKTKCDDGFIDDAQEDLKILKGFGLDEPKNEVLVEAFDKIFESLRKRGNDEKAKKFYNSELKEIRKFNTDVNLVGIFINSSVNLANNLELTKTVAGSLVASVLILCLVNAFLMSNNK